MNRGKDIRSSRWMNERRDAWGEKGRRIGRTVRSRITNSQTYKKTHQRVRLYRNFDKREAESGWTKNERDKQQLFLHTGEGVNKTCIKQEPLSIKQNRVVVYCTREQRVNGFDGTDWPRLEVLYKKKSASTLLHRERAKSGFKRTIVSYGEQNGRKENPPFPKKNLVPPGVEYSLHLVCNAFEIAGGPQKNTPTSESECFSVRDENTRSQLGRPK